MFYTEVVPPESPSPLSILQIVDLAGTVVAPCTGLANVMFTCAEHLFILHSRVETRHVSRFSPVLFSKAPPIASTSCAVKGGCPYTAQHVATFCILLGEGLGRCRVLPLTVADQTSTCHHTIACFTSCISEAEAMSTNSLRMRLVVREHACPSGTPRAQPSLS